MTVRRQRTHPLGLPGAFGPGISGSRSTRGRGRPPERARSLARATHRSQGGPAGRCPRAVEQRRRLPSAGRVPRTHRLPRPGRVALGDLQSGARIRRRIQRGPHRGRGRSRRCARTLLSIHGSWRRRRGQAQRRWVGCPNRGPTPRPDPGGTSSTTTTWATTSIACGSTPKMVYTCAYYDTPQATLEQAQRGQDGSRLPQADAASGPAASSKPAVDGARWPCTWRASSESGSVPSTSRGSRMRICAGAGVTGRHGRDGGVRPGRLPEHRRRLRRLRLRRHAGARRRPELPGARGRSSHARSGPAASRSFTASGAIVPLRSTPGWSSGSSPEATPRACGR